jgi:hypothetical protein
LTSAKEGIKMTTLSTQLESNMENQAIDQAVEFFMNIIHTSKFETLYNEFEDSAEDDKLREFIKSRLQNRNK